MSKLLAGKIDPRIGPWLSGAPLTALIKKTGGDHPIAVGDGFRRLARTICCAFIRNRLPDVFVPYGQVGVGLKGEVQQK